MTRYPRRRNVKRPTRIAIQGIWVLEAKLDILREHIVARLRVVIGYPLISKSPSNYFPAYSLHSFPPANVFSASPSTLNPTHSDILFAPNASQKSKLGLFQFRHDHSSLPPWIFTTSFASSRMRAFPYPRLRYFGFTNKSSRQMPGAARQVLQL